MFESVVEMLMDHCWFNAVDLYPHGPTKLKKSRKLSTRMTLGFKVRGIFLWSLFLLRLDYSMAATSTCRNLDDFDHCAGMLPNLKNELKGSCLLEFVNGLLSSCGDEQIIVFTTNNRDHHDAARRRHLNEDIYVHKSSPQPVALADEGEIVQLNSSRQKPLVDFVATNIKAYQSSLLVSNSEEKNTTEASARRCMTESGHSLGDERPFEVMNLSADGKLVSRLQRIHISWLGSFAPRPSALPGGGESVGPIALSSSEFASTNNKAQRFGQDKSGSAASDSKKKRTRKQEDCKEINTSITLDDLRQHYGRKRKDVAESLGVSVSMLKRTCRQYGIKQWPNIIKKKAGRPPDQHGEKILSPTCKTLSTNGQNEMENEIVGHLEETNEFLLNFVEGPNGGVSSEWAFELRDQWTVSTSYPNSNGPEVPHPHIASTQILGENMGSLGDRRNSFGSLEEHILQGHISGSMWTVPPCSDPASSQHMPTITPTMGSSEDQISSLAFVEDVFLEEDVSGSISWTIPTCFEPAPTQLMPSVSRLSGSSDDLGNLLPSVEECFSARHVSGFINGTVPSCSYPGPSQPMSIVPHTTGSSDALRNFTYDFAAELSGELCHRDTEQRFFFVPRQEREARGGRPSRTAASGYWKATGSPNYVYSSDNRVIGMKKTMVFYEGKAPSGRKTEWKMNEYKAIDQETSTPFGCAVPKPRHEFSLCRVYLIHGSFQAFDRHPLWAETKRSDTQQLVHDLTESVLSFDDPTIRKLLPDRTSLASLELTSRDFDDFDHCAAMLLESDIGLPDGGHILSLSEKKIVRKISKRMCRTMSVLSLEDHQPHVGRSWEDAVKFLGAKRIYRQLAIHRETTRKRICRQLGTRRWPFKQSSIRLPDVGQIQSLSEKKIVRKTLKKKCRSMSVLSLEVHKHHVDRRWEDAAKSHGAKRICRQLVIHRLSTAKLIRKQHGIHWWPFQRSFISLPDGGHILPLSETKIMRKTLKRKCRSMSVRSLVDRQQHVDRRWEDAVKNIGAKRICRQLVIHRVSIAKHMCRQHGIYHRWPFQQDLATMKGYSLGDERPVEVISLSKHAKLVSRLQLIYISWLSRFSPWPSALAGGGEVGGPIALSLSESATTKNIAQRVGQDQSGSAASDTENERTREQEDLEEIYTSITSDDLRRLYGRMNRKDAAASLGVSVATFKRKCREFGIQRWPHVRKKKVGRPPDQHGERNTSTACKMPLHNVHARMEGEPVGQNQEANEFRQDFMEHSIALNTENDSIIAVYSETEAARGSSKWAFQLEGQTMQSTTYPYHDDLGFSQSQITSTKVVNENMGSFGNQTVGSCSDPASSQTMRTLSHATGSLENFKNWIDSMDEDLMEENVYGSSRSDPAPSQPVHTIHHAMATIPQIPTERQDKTSVELKATYGDTKIKFQFPLTSGINELKEVMSKILERELGSFKVEYKDGYGEWILMGLDEHVREYLQLLTSLGNKVTTELKVQDKVPNATNFCGNCRCNNCRSLKRKRP